MIWCEHCRDHFEIEHYRRNKHMAGIQYGPVGRDMATRLNDREIAAVVAALRSWQGDESLLSRAEIDVLCERLSSVIEVGASSG